MTHDSKNGLNGSGRGPEDEKDEDNVVSFADIRAKEKQRQREEEAFRKAEAKAANPPMINLPPVTKVIILLNILIFGVLLLAGDEYKYIAFYALGFIPEYFTSKLGQAPIYSYLSPVTHMFLHSGWLHIIMNVGMLAAFGSLVEKVYGAKPFIAFYICCGIIGVLGHLIVEPFSQVPVVGASGAISGLFAAVIIVLQRLGQLGQGKYGIWPIVLIWCGISFLFAWAGGAGIGDIAWAAHLGGFLGAFALLRITYFKI